MIIKIVQNYCETSFKRYLWLVYDKMLKQYFNKTGGAKFAKGDVTAYLSRLIFA